MFKYLKSKFKSKSYYKKQTPVEKYKYQQYLDDKLYQAINENDIPLVRELIHKGANINKLNVGGYPLIIAIRRGQNAVINELLDGGVNVNIIDVDIFGNTPLILASKYGSINLIKKLFEHDADPTKTNYFGQTALELARDSQTRKVIERILYLWSIRQLKPLLRTILPDTLVRETAQHLEKEVLL